jgi:hypothetical protein
MARKIKRSQQLENYIETIYRLVTFLEMWPDEAGAAARWMGHSVEDRVICRIQEVMAR